MATAIAKMGKEDQLVHQATSHSGAIIEVLVLGIGLETNGPTTRILDAVNSSF